MTAKRFTLAYADYDWWAICDKENPTELGISGEDVVELLNELYEENKGIQDKIFKLLDWLETKKGVSRKEIKEWWND